MAEAEAGTRNIGGGGNPGPWIRKVGLRAEIDTTPPFGSVKEAVTRFGGSSNSAEDFDIKKVEELAAKLEKDLIVKELETLDVLEELAATKRIVEGLKQQLQTEALKCLATPDVKSNDQVGAPVVKEMNRESYGNIAGDREQKLQSPSPRRPTSSPDQFFMELEQAKSNLGRTINDLGAIQCSVESLNKKMKKERLFLERTREKLASKSAAVSAQQKRAQEQARSNPSTAPSEIASFTFDTPFNILGNFEYDGMVEKIRSEVSKPLPYEGNNGLSIKTAEMRWFAAKKMEEAARAAEAIAVAEIEALSGARVSSGFALPMPEPRKVTFSLGEQRFPLNPELQIPEESTLKNVIDTKFQIDEINTSKLNILKKLEEATEEVLLSKKLLTEALNSVENANRKQLAAKEALRRWIPEDAPLPDQNRSRTMNNDRKPLLRSTVSMRDVLSRKQVCEEYTATKETEEHAVRQKVALSQMLQALKDDLNTLPSIPEKDESPQNQKQFATQRKKFGFIQISLPLGRPSKKRA